MAVVCSNHLNKKYKSLSKIFSMFDKQNLANKWLKSY